MWDSLISYCSYALLITGSFLSLTFAIGLLRFPDFYTRMHAAGVSDTLCAALIVLGLVLQAGISLVTLKLLFILLFLWFTSPTASYALARAAHRAGYGVSEQQEVTSSNS